MKRLLRILVRLYPADWRRRYGLEFEALLEDARPGLGGALDILKGALIMQLTKNFMIVAAAIVVVLGVLTAMDVGNRVRRGYQFGSQMKVTTVEVGSPAAAAGLQVGDVLKSVNGVAGWKGVRDMPRPAAGVTWTYVVERGGQTVNLRFPHTPLAPNEVSWAIARELLGLCVLGFALWAYFSAPGTPTIVLAVSVLGLSVTVPNFESAPVRTVGGIIALVSLVLGTAAAVHFLLVFPSRWLFLNRPWGTKILYAPGVIVALITIVAMIYPAERTDYLFGTVLSSFLLVYPLAAMVLLVGRYVAATAADRRLHGLRLLLVAVAVGVGPYVLYPIVNLLLPEYAKLLPRGFGLGLGISISPIFFAIAAVRSARAKPFVGSATVAPVAQLPQG
ncbi:MAG: hypothetical protein HYZ37_08020 [Candidatus Solibacter usitatus]|nr:hypothetical protein [Candidatus Solibacter usitatus]